MGIPLFIPFMNYFYMGKYENHYEWILAQNNYLELLRTSMTCIFPSYIDLGFWKKHFPFDWILILGLFSLQKDLEDFRSFDLNLDQGSILIPKNVIKLDFSKDSFQKI